MTVVLGQRRERAYKTSKIRLPGDSVKLELTTSSMSLHIEKKKRQQMNAQQRHDERDDEKYKKQKHKNKNIDKSRTHLNKVLHREDGTYVERFDRVIEEKYKGKQKVRSNAVTMVEITVNLGGGVNELSMEEQNEVLTNMYEYLKGKYPEVIGAVIHNDETNPGLHMSIVPLTEDGRLSAKELFSRGKLQHLQKDALAYIQGEYPRLGFHRLSEHERLYNGLSIEQAETLKNEREELIKEYEELCKALEERAKELDDRSAKLDKRESMLDEREKALNDSSKMLEDSFNKVEQYRQHLETVEGRLDSKAEQLNSESLKLEEHKAELQQTEQKQRNTATRQREENERLLRVSEVQKKNKRYLDSHYDKLKTEREKVNAMRDKVTSMRDKVSEDSLRVQQQHQELKRLIEELKDSTRVSKVRSRKIIEEFEESQTDDKQFADQLNDVDDFISSLNELTQDDGLNL